MSLKMLLEEAANIADMYRFIKKMDTGRTESIMRFTSVIRARQLLRGYRPFSANPYGKINYVQIPNIFDSLAIIRNRLWFIFKDSFYLFHYTWSQFF